MYQKLCAMPVAKPDLVNGEGEDINDPVVGSVAKEGVAAMPEGGAHRQACKT
jgi:hypothetical protein